MHLLISGSLKRPLLTGPVMKARTACRAAVRGRDANKTIVLAMKLTFLLLTAAFLQVSAKGFTQGITFSGKEVPLQTVFDAISKQTGYTVFCNYELLQKAGKVTVRLRDASVERAMQEILKDQSLTFTIIEKTIVVKEKEVAPAKEGVDLAPPPIDISGKVTDPEGHPLEGATVKVKGSNQGTSTNAKGEFVLKGVEEDAVLEVSFVGFEPQIIAVKNRATISLVLKRSENKLDEIQIQAYGTTTKRLSTGNITTIKASEIAKQPINNPIMALMSRVPNLIISPTSGNPGASFKIQLRGQNSLGGTIYDGLTKSSEPLIVVDGIPYLNNISAPTGGSFGFARSELSALSFINPSDIESIDVLSDADATSIYGSRGGERRNIDHNKKGKSR